MNNFYSNYFSIEDILTTQEKIPCKIKQNIPELGKLDPSSDSPDLPAGTDLELPLWLIQSIRTVKPPIIEASLPKAYTETYREILNADPTALDIHRLNTNFYDLGCYLMSFDPKKEIGESLMHTFQNRFRLILNLCEETRFDPGTIERLDSLEKRLYHGAHASRMNLNKWLVESNLTMQPAKMIVNHKKRKRVHMDL